MQATTTRRPAGMRAFIVVWFGQIASLMGTGMTQFAITLWAWEMTGQATALTLVAFFTFGPTVLLSPVAGALVDRWNRKLVMMLSDVGTSIATVFILIMHLTGNLEIWHLYIAGAFSGVFQSFQFPAYSAAISTMVSKDQYARTSAMLGLADSSSAIVAPLIAATLYVAIGLNGILILDCVTFAIAITTLLIVHIPQPPPSKDGAEGKGSLLVESLYGFKYILKRPSLLGLQLVFLAGNLLTGFCFVLISPMILARTGNNELMLASVLSTMGVGGLVGGLIMSTWGGPKRRIHGVLGGWMLGSAGIMLLGIGQELPVWMVGGFILVFCTPLINASNQAIWQTKVPPDVQGRVFAVRRLIAQIAGPLAMFMAGPLADFIFEPILRGENIIANTQGPLVHLAMTPTLEPAGAFAALFGGVVGIGPGAGMGLMFFLFGGLCSTVGLMGYLIPRIRNVEDIIPDHVVAEVEGLEAETVAAAQSAD